MSVKGTLIPIGGNEDKGGKNKNERLNLDYIEDGILARVVKESGGEEARIVVIPTASSIPVEVGDNYIKAFKRLGCVNVDVLDIRNREDSEKEESIELVKAANCIMFSGGNQSKITEKIGDTTIHSIMMDRYQNEDGFVIAGTSAGAMVMAKEMIAGGSSTEAFFKGTVTMSRGLGFAPRLIIDSHFIRRGRFGRQAEALAKFTNKLGLGLAEDTGIVITNGDEIEVIGSGMIIIFDASNLTHNNELLLDEGTPMSLSNLVVHILSNGDHFNIKTREVKILPMGSPFV
jgi:cyanophycinase